MEYKKVDVSIITRLMQIVGEKNVLTKDEEKESYSHDETLNLRRYMPETVVKPSNRNQVRDILILANKERIPITPRGGGTGLSGGAVPLYGGILISLERMNEILELDKENMMAVLEPGVTNGELQREVEKYELFYPVNPASLDSCTIGGNVAESAGGANAVKYGITKNYVCGLEAVLPTGKTLRAGGKILKNATNSQFIDILLGSEGTLAVITEITMKLVPRPRVKVDLIVPFDDLGALCGCALKIVNDRLLPTTIELMDRLTIKTCGEFLQKELPFSEAKAHLWIGLDGNKKEEVESMYQSIGEICLDKGALDVFVAEDKRNRDRIWQARQSIHEALVHFNPKMVGNDIVVPRSKVLSLIKGIDSLSRKHSVSFAKFGHLGDGNIHVYILQKNINDTTWEKVKSEAVQELFELTISLGGLISGEHGIGLVKKKYLSLVMSETQIKLMKGIKKVFDPHNILNPGKIFDS